MSNTRYNVLFLCTANSARSLFAEAILNSLGQGRFRAFSAGSRPADRIHPEALTLLESMKLPTAGLRSKNWHEFTTPSAPGMDFVFTVCDRSTAEPCPIRPGHPVTAHWGVEDPALTGGDRAARHKAFRTAFFGPHSRISLFMNLPLMSLDRMRLQPRLDEIGRLSEETTP